MTQASWFKIEILSVLNPEIKNIYFILFFTVTCYGYIDLRLFFMYTGEFYDEQIDGDFESEEAEEVAYTEPTMYDSLSKKLGSRNVSVANALRRR